MKTLNKILILVLLFSFGCKDKEEDPPTETDLLTEATWYHNATIVDMNNNFIPDDETQSGTDVYMRFDKDGSLLYGNDDTTKNLTWQFESNGKIVRIFGVMNDSIIPPVTESDHEIYQLDENSLIFYYQSTASHPETGTFEKYGHSIE